MLDSKIVSHLNALNLDFNIQLYLKQYFETVDFSQQTESTIINDLEYLITLYEQQKIDEKIFGIIFNRLPNLQKYSKNL